MVSCSHSLEAQKTSKSWRRLSKRSTASAEALNSLLTIMLDKRWKNLRRSGDTMSNIAYILAMAKSSLQYLVATSAGASRYTQCFDIHGPYTHVTFSRNFQVVVVPYVSPDDHLTMKSWSRLTAVIIFVKLRNAKCNETRMIITA